MVYRAILQLPNLKFCAPLYLFFLSTTGSKILSMDGQQGADSGSPNQTIKKTRKDVTMATKTKPREY
jgi:hypothetical protein